MYWYICVYVLHAFFSKIYCYVIQRCINKPSTGSAEENYFFLNYVIMGPIVISILTIFIFIFQNIILLIRVWHESLFLLRLISRRQS